MGFSINTNISAMNAHQIGVQNNRLLDGSLEKLSTGLRINKSADDASGMAIADSLRSQASVLGQAIRNANDGIGIVQIADKGMDEQVKILDTIKTKATQAAQDGQTEESRKMLQGDITKLMQEMDNISQTTIYNGQSLLNGSFTNKQFQIGSYSNQAINISVGATGSSKIGTTRFETGATITAAHMSALKFLAVDGSKDITLESAVISTSAGTGISALAEIINKNANAIGVRASWKVVTTGQTNIKSGTIQGLTLNGVNLGNINDVQANDRDGKLIAAINRLTDKHGVEAFVDERGNLNLRSIDGRGIRVTATGATDGATAGVTGLLGLGGAGVSGESAENYGRLTLTRLDGRDITLSGTAKGVAGVAATGFDGTKEAETTLNLRGMLSGFTVDQASAMGAFANFNTSLFSAANQTLANGSKAGIGSGVTTLEGAMVMMDVSETAMKMLDSVRANLGATQNQIVATVNNISVTQVNVKAAESQIRDVDFASESANFQKQNILAQSGSYALSQANAVQLNIMKLLT